MSDLFASLRKPEPASPLAPEEVRRRGDRLRRRRAGLVVAGAACAAAVVVGSASLVFGDRTSSDSAPGPAKSPAAETVIPAEFDLGDGLSREVVGPGAVAPPMAICGEPFSLADGATASQGIRHVSTGDLTARGLGVYPDVGTAEEVANDLVDRFESCPRFTDDQGREWTTNIRPTAHGDQGWVVTRFTGAAGAREESPEAIQIVRLGANLLVVQQSEIHGVASEALSRWTSDQVAWLLHRQMCLLTDEGCAWRSDPDILRPDGWGPLRLGMSREDLDATGITELSSAGDCTMVDLGPGTGWLSGSDELVSIQVPEGVTTPDGIGVGSSQQEVIDLYYYGEQVGDVRLVRASPTTDYEITVERGEVTELRLSTVGDECLG